LVLPFDTMGAWLSRAGAGALSVVIGFSGVSGCTAATPADWWDDGSGGSKPVALLRSLDAQGRNCSPVTVESMDCAFSSGGVSVFVRREFNAAEGTDVLMVVAFDGMMRGTQTTTATGYLDRYVGITEYRCFSAVSTYMAPEPCEVELQGIQRGERQDQPLGTGGTASAAVRELGSRVRIRVSCPDGLYYPGTDDVNAYYIPIVPSEFALEAQDCVVVDDGVLPEGQP
jgi:hypothetical protein